MSKIILLILAGLFLQVCVSSLIDVIVELFIEIEGTKVFVDLEAINAALILNQTQSKIDDKIEKSNSTLTTEIKNLETSVLEGEMLAFRNKKSILGCLNQVRDSMSIFKDGKDQFISCRQLVELAMSKKYIKRIENTKRVLDGTIGKCIENNPFNETAMKNCGFSDMSDVKLKAIELKFRLKAALNEIAEKSLVCNDDVLDKLSAIVDKTSKDFSACLDIVLN